jgi:hypothetical protein
MSIRRGSLPAAGILILSIAVLLCLSIGAAGGHDMQAMSSALVCCLILAVVGVAFVLGIPARSLQGAIPEVGRLGAAVARWLFPAVRPPTAIELCSLLI